MTDPRLGDIVHFRTCYGYLPAICYASIITGIDLALDLQDGTGVRVDNNTVSLTTFTPNGTFSHERIRYDPGMTGPCPDGTHARPAGTWHDIH